MRIGIDARWIFKELSGIGAYTRELVTQLARIDRENDYILIFQDEALRDRTVREAGLEAVPNVQTRILAAGLFSIRNQLDTPRRIMEWGLDVFHSPNYMIPLRAFPPGRPHRTRCVTNLHDLIPMMFRQYAPRSRKNRLFPLYKWIMYQVGRRSSLIITGSQSAREDIIRCLRIPSGQESKVVAIPDGVASRFKPGRQAGMSEPRSSKTVLWVGRPDPYKNLVGLIEAFARLRSQLRLPVRLRLIGPPDARYPEPRQRAAELGVANDVEWVGYVTDECLVQEYQRANVFVMPSFYEGFGLPVIEAMACGTPVVCSNKGSLPEVAGGAAVMVSPTDRIGISEAIKRLLLDDRLSEQLRRQGFQRAATYTWEQTARLTLAAYRRLG